MYFIVQVCDLRPLDGGSNHRNGTTQNLSSSSNVLQYSTSRVSYVSNFGCWKVVGNYTWLLYTEEGSLWLRFTTTKLRFLCSPQKKKKLSETRATTTLKEIPIFFSKFNSGCINIPKILQNKSITTVVTGLTGIVLSGPRSQITIQNIPNRPPAAAFLFKACLFTGVEILPWNTKNNVL